MKTEDTFLIIDDDTTSTLLYSIMLKHALGNINVQCFNRPDEGVNYIKNEFKNPESKTQTIVFLDINMPILTGWDVLDLIDKMNNDTKNQLIIFMLSSSIDLRDKKRAIDHLLVTDFIEKPLTIEKIQALFNLH